MLAAERKRQGLSQQVLADMAGLSRTGLRHMESGNINPTLYTFLKVAGALKIDFPELMLKSQRGIRRRVK
jgi:transcriptional regulator with XRE-family HTH domain